MLYMKKNKKIPASKAGVQGRGKLETSCISTEAMEVFKDVISVELEFERILIISAHDPR